MSTALTWADLAANGESSEAPAAPWLAVHEARDYRAARAGQGRFADATPAAFRKYSAGIRDIEPPTADAAPYRDGGRTKDRL
jgi:hypothetical protein